MTLSEIGLLLGAELHINEDQDIKSFQTDTRELIGKKDELFIALRAARDGHQYIPDAIKKGTSNFLVSVDLEHACNYLKVEDTLISFQKIAASHRSYYKIPIVGITGSNGKTTVKEWLSTLLSESFYVCKSPKSYNSQIGVAHSLLSLNSGHEIGVFEAGISQKGEMQSLQKMIKPSLGIFTTLGSAHDFGFNDRNEKLKEKLILFDKAEQVIAKHDNQYLSIMRNVLGNKLITWGDTSEADINVVWKRGQIQIADNTFNTTLTDSTDLENVTNALIAAEVLGVAGEKIQQGLDKIKSVPMRLELKRGANDTYILDDSYNNDLEGLKVAINYLRGFRQKEKKTVILSDIISHGAPVSIYKQVNQLLMDNAVDRLIGIGEGLAQHKDHFDLPASFYRSVDDFLAHPTEFHNEMVLVKGARGFNLELIVRELQQQLHGTRLEINFEAMRHNLKEYQNLLESTTALMVMVKANAYGAGILEVANFLQNQKVDMLGVAYVDEAIQLRQNGIYIPIMIMNPHIDSFGAFEKYNLQAEIFNLNHLKKLLQDTTGEVEVQIKIDTGMHRLGFQTNGLEELITFLKKNSRIRVKGIFTHFASSENKTDDEFTKQQAQTFDRSYKQIVEGIGYTPVKHACNSSGIVRWKEYHYDMVRLGIGLHGLDPTNSLILRVVSQLKSTVSQIQLLSSGESIGYSRKGRVDRESKIAVIPIGYEDGFVRLMGNGVGKVAINNQTYPTIGNVCMDMIMVDVTEGEVKEGDEVVIFGTKPTLLEVAQWAQTIPYEVLTNVSSRVRRVFLSE